MQALADDLVDGAADAAEYVFGDRGKRRLIYRMTEKGEIPAVRKGGKLFYRKSALDRAFQVG